MTMLSINYRIKSFLVEARFHQKFSINANAWEALDLFPTDSFGYLSSGGVEGRDLKRFYQYQLEFNRASFLAENIDGLPALEEWIIKASKFINYAMSRWEIPVVKRLGVRLHLQLNAETPHDHDYYAGLIASGFNLFTAGEIKQQVNTGGFVFRFTEAPWMIRFGAFSCDSEVMRKYHKFNPPESLFNRPGIIYDVDCFKTDVDASPKAHLTGKFDVSSHIRDAHKVAANLAMRHVKLINAPAKI